MKFMKARHVMIEFSPNEKDAWEAAVNFRDVDDWYVSKLRSSGQWARKGGIYALAFFDMTPGRSVSTRKFSTRKI